MPSIPIVGKCFATTAEFLAYLEGLRFEAWRPKYVTMHHTGSPSLAVWEGWQTRAKPVTDEQWMINLGAYYASLGWRSGPQFFFTPKHYCVLSIPTARGVHAVSFNAQSWGVEVVGDFDREALKGDYLDRVVSGFAALHLAAGLQPEPYRRGESGLHFHRDDPKTSKTCPGKSIAKDVMIEKIERAMAAMSGDSDAPGEQVEETPRQPDRIGVVTGDESLNIRVGASAKTPIVGALKPGAQVKVVGEAMNGPTKWYAIDGDQDGYVAARYVRME